MIFAGFLPTGLEFDGSTMTFYSSTCTAVSASLHLASSSSRSFYA